MYDLLNIWKQNYEIEVFNYLTILKLYFENLYTRTLTTELH